MLPLTMALLFRVFDWCKHANVSNSGGNNLILINLFINEHRY